MTRSRDVADTQDNIGGAVAPFVAGKNAVINGGFDIWQRGTTFTNGGQYTADRWFFDISASTVTSTRESTIVPAGFQYSWKINKSAGSATATLMAQTIETANAIQFAGKTVTFSFYAAADSATTFTPVLTYSTSADNPRTGSWTNITPTVNGSTSVSTTTFVRIVSTFTVPSTAKSLFMYIEPTIASGANIYVTGFQLELGSVATPFSRAGGSIGGELALCQRYFQRIGNNAGAYYMYTSATVEGTSTLWGTVPLPVTMRTTPSMSATSSGNTFTILGYANVNSSVIYLDAAQSGPQSIVMGANTISGLTLRQSCYIRNLNDTSGTYISMNAEL